MPTIEQELDDFTRFAREQLEKGGVDCSIDELFDLWRAKNPSDELYAENVAAIRASLRDYNEGERGTIAGEHSDELRREFNLADQ